MPEMSASLPEYENPFFTNISPIYFAVSPPNDVPYLSDPYNAPALPAISYSNLPTVIRLGYPCGFIIRSGLHPLYENGISY
jgi:hypothetical protein